MTADPAKSVIGLEYFAWEGDALWTQPDGSLLDIAKADLARLRLVDPGLVEDGFVVRYPKAYPVYDDGYRSRLAAIRDFLNQFQNLVCVGRYGQFRYNNMDHSIMTALLGVASR